MFYTLVAFRIIDVSGNEMRPFTIILLAIIISSCVTDKKQDSFIVPFERGYENIKLDLDTVKNAIVLSDAFWKHFTSTFPSPTIVMFNRLNDPYDNVLELSDSYYTYGLISSRNQLFLRNHLPKNLSKEESESYWEGTAFFIIPDSTTARDGHAPEVAIERHWSKAPEAVEKEYLKFYALVTDFKQEYAIIAKRALVDSIMQKYK
jgi:hypothetical protein